MKSDVRLHADIAEELRFDPRVDHKTVAISVRDGVVTLSGTVLSYAQQLAAEAAVKRVSGVRGFAEDVKVELQAAHVRNDTDVARAAANALAWHVTLPKGAQAMVRRGIVTLEGQVDWQFEREEAPGAVANLAGVRAVNNFICVKPRTVTPAAVRSQIERELERIAEGTAKRIAIENRAGRITLRGVVHSLAERDEVAMAASRTPGMTAVENLLPVVG